MATADASALTLEITRRFAATPERVFDAWLGQSWGEWLPPAGARCEVVEMDRRTDGRYHIRMTMPDGRITNISGSYREIKRPEKLVLSWLGDYTPAKMLITLTFHRDNCGTLMHLRQEGFPDQALRDSYNKGWTGPKGSFEKLDAVLEKGSAS